MATSTMAEALAASLPAPQTEAAATKAQEVTAIPQSMAKLIDLETEIGLKVVQLDGLVVSKIIKHSQEAKGNYGTGLLLGLDLDGVLEVSNCFPLPHPSSLLAEGDDDKFARSAARYQGSMLRSLKDIQRDDNVVGFYQSITLGSHMTASLVDMLGAQHGKLRHGGVVIVHDVSQAAKGHATFRAFKLTRNYMEVYRKGRFTSQQLAEHGLTYGTLLEELGVQVRNSALLNGFLAGLRRRGGVEGEGEGKRERMRNGVEGGYRRLNLGRTEEVHVNLEAVVEKLDEYKNEEANVAFLQRQIAREKGRAEAYVGKRKEENATRVGQGLVPLPEEDVSRLFKIPPEPSRVEGMLLLGQIEGLGRNLEKHSGDTLVRGYAVRSGAA